MSFYTLNSPYGAGYAIPKYVKDEPSGRGTHTTAQARRGTIDIIPNPPTAGYAVPKYVRKEVPGRGVIRTAWAPRGTISGKVPDSLAPHSLSGSSLAGSSIGGSSLGNNVLPPGVDPLSQYGSEASAAILRAVRSVPADQRPKILKAVLNEIDSSLYRKVEKRMKSGTPMKAALEIELKEGITKEILKLGHPSRAAALAGYQPTEGLWDSIKSAVKKVAVYSNPLTAQAALAVKFAKTDMAKDIYNKAADAVNAVGRAACKVANNKFTTVAATGVSAAYGAPPTAAATGTAVAQSLCAKDPPPPPPGLLERSPAWLVPAAVGGGALLLILALKK